MPFHSGDPKPPNSGRKKGTPNRINKEVAERLAELRIDPVAGLARIAVNRRNRPELRARCYAELLEYVKPKRRRIDIGTDGGPVELLVRYADRQEP